ncbi:uncharacterized protein PV06_02771 [Exophiala oligosperma]|uniref:Mitochondrial protein Fmp25 n=1 Tax=Exophiala oligosperma TaxID=215243 RepID=A0A0D2DVP8_9EURO|nr:uncharacterized protein PV06_02771 [Exophiala oligosperma]KIW47173.1 hypothetical protein PV06_02771 [Exophiala oligosperma]
MALTKLNTNAARSLVRSQRPGLTQGRSRVQLYNSRRHIHNASAHHSAHHQAWKRPSTAIFAVVASIAVVYSASQPNHVQAEAPAQEPPELVIEKSKKKKGASKEEIRDLISSQHLQVKKSWENPGVYAWGSNTGKVVAPDSDEAYVKIPRRIPYFDDVLLRDLKLDRNFGAAVLENGDLVQWGKGYSEDTVQPTVTLKGKNLSSIVLSRDRIIGLGKNGTVYSVPVSKLDQESGKKMSESSWIPFWSSTSDVAYRKLAPKGLGAREKVTAISGGLEHVLLLTNSGRVFSAASGTEDFPNRGQLGVPGVTWLTRPEGPYDMCHELTTLKGFDIAKMASGDTHSLVLDKEGRVFAFGDNSSGQLGFDYNAEAPYVDTPSLLPISKYYQGTNQVPKVTSISAGGQNSFFTVDATRVVGPSEEPSEIRTLGRVTSDTWSCGTGIRGALGNGRWTHIQDGLTKIPALSGLFEYDERKKSVIPIRMAQISVGATHVSAVMDNVTYLDASEKSSENDTNWGADVLWWGGNEFYQLGTGKRNNVPNPMYIKPLDAAAEAEAGRKEEHRFHLTPKHTVKVKGRKVQLEQRVECGRNVTAVYSGV